MTHIKLKVLGFCKKYEHSSEVSLTERIFVDQKIFAARPQISDRGV